MSIPEFYLDFWRAYDALRPLALFTFSIVLYGVFVFHFYRFLARKDIFHLNLDKFNESRHPALRKTVSVFFYLVRSLVMFPLFIAFWFIVLAGLLLLMGRSQTIDGIMLGAMGVVATIRVCAYYKEALATDIAKILPFALLGIMLIDSSLVRIPQSADTIQDAAMRLETVTYYLIAVVVLEFLLRIVSSIIGLVTRAFKRTKSPSKDVDAKPDAVDRAPTATPSPATARGPSHGTPPAVGLEFDRAYGRPQYDLPARTRARLSETGRAPANFSGWEGKVGDPGASRVRNGTLRE